MIETFNRNGWNGTPDSLGKVARNIQDLTLNALPKCSMICRRIEKDFEEDFQEITNNDLIGILCGEMPSGN